MSGFDLWRNNSPVVTFAALATPPTLDREFLAEALAVLAEAGKGLPPGWVSQWGDKKVQKQTDGNWGYVPNDTQLGMQPYYKGSGQTVTLTHDEEMLGYLKSINFDDPTQQKTLTNSPKFVGDMLKKFGAGWFDRFKKMAGKVPGPVPAAPPTAPPDHPVKAALKLLNIAPTAKLASAVELLHKLGSLDKAANAYSKQHGMKFAPAFYEMEALVKKGASKGVFSIKGDFESDVKVTFNVGTGPVISAPAVAATTSAPSLGLKPTLPKAVKAKKPAPSDSTPVPPAPFVPALPAVDVPTNPQVLALAAKLGADPKSDTAKALSIWRKHLKKNHIGASYQAAVEISSFSGISQEDAESFVKDLTKKVYATSGWDAADFMVDPEPPKPTQTPGTIPAPVAPTPAPEVPTTLSLDKAVSDMVGKLGYKMGSAGAVAVGMLHAHDGDLVAAAKGLAASLGWTDAAAGKVAAFVWAKINAMKSGTDQPEAPLAVAKLIGGAPAAPKTRKPSPGPITLPLIPPMATLSFAGDAKTKLGGNKPKKFLKDDDGNLFLHKYGADQLRAAGGEVASTIASILIGPGGYVPVKAVEYEGDWGTVQPIVPDIVKGGLSADPTEMTKDEIKQLQRERVIDWVISNHDSKIGNFIKTTGGQIFGIDKEQAFKFIGQDKLALDYSPNPSEPIYNALYQAYADKKIDLDPNDMLPLIQAAENTTDTQWMEAVKPYIAGLPQGSEMDAKLNAIVNRKNNLRKDFEAFFTMLRKKRGEGPFTFATPPATAPAVAVAPDAPELKKLKPVGALGSLVPPSLPPLSSLTYEGPAKIGGAGEKHFYTDSAGKKWMLKVAAGKGTGKSEPWKVAAQTLFSMVGAWVKPHTLPVGPTDFKGQPATLQPWLGSDLKTLSDEQPKFLTTVMKKDVATEHVLDWLMSQHDTHGGNLVVVPETGAVVGIDKEQGFKYLMPSLKWTNSTPEGDKLSTDYHPNAQYGEQEPYYNKFWKAFADNAMTFDPLVMKAAIEAVEKIDDAAYTAGLVGYAQAVYPEDAAQAAQFYEKAFARKKNIRKEFEAFITDLYKKRTKKEGLFAFNSGWVPEGASAPVPAGLPAVPVPAPAPAKVTSAPFATAVPKPEGYVPPPGFAAAAAHLGFNPGSVYYPALKHLHLYANHPGQAANQLSFSSSISPEIAFKRVKYALNKLKAAGGWAAFNPGSQTAPAATGGASTPSAAPVSGYTPLTALNPAGSLSGTKAMVSFVPGADGELGNTALKLVSPSEAFKPPPPPPLPPVPAGFEPPPEGKKWEVSKASAFFTSGGASGKLYKTKLPKKADGTPDTESPNLVAKFQSTSLDAVKQALKQVGVDGVVPLKEKAPYVIGVFKKEDWEKAQQSDKQLGVLVDLPPPPPPPSGKFTAIPQAGELKNAPATNGIKELEKVQDALLGFGVGFRIDGPAVEHHSMSVQRRLNTIGKPYYRFMFKLREPVWTKLKGYNSAQGHFKRATYSAKDDAFKETNTTEYSYSARQWSAGAGSTVVLGTGDDGAYAVKGQVTCDVYPEGDQTPLEALKKLLKTMGPTLADEVLRDPTPEDEKLLKLSALFWSAVPAEADALPDYKRTAEHLTARLKQEGFTDEQMDSVRFERVGIDQIVPVLPGRGKAIQAKHKISHVSVAVSSPAKVMLQIRGGTVGCVQRLKHGFSLAGSTSASSDIESGGGDYVFAMPGKKDESGWANSWGTIEMVYDPSELDRLDPFMYDFDGYGNTKDSKFHSRHTLEAMAGSASEIVFRQGMNVNKLLKIRCKDESAVPEIIKLMKDSGVTKINGMTPEELVVHGGDFYDTFLKPAGY